MNKKSTKRPRKVSVKNLTKNTLKTLFEIQEKSQKQIEIERQKLVNTISAAPVENQEIPPTPQKQSYQYRAALWIWVKINKILMTLEDYLHVNYKKS